MPFFKDANNNVHYLQDESKGHFLPDGCVQITEIEAGALAAQKNKATPLKDIAAQEAKEVYEILFDAMLNNKPISPELKAYFKAVKDIEKGIDTISKELPIRPNKV